MSFALLALLIPRATAAQAAPIVLTVQLRSTVADAPVPNIAVLVLDAASGQLLARGTTDRRGQLRFVQMPPTEVRVQLTGTLPDGTALRPTPQDSNGIWVNLPQRDWRMDLRVDTDGLVFPDLSAGSAGAPDAQDGIAVVPTASGAAVHDTPATLYPTAPIADGRTAIAGAHGTAAMAPASIPGGRAAAGTDVSAAGSVPAASNLSGGVLLALLLALIGGVLWVNARSRL